MISLILIGKPESLNIPYFAMSAPSSRETSWFFPKNKSSPLSSLVSGNTYRWINEQQKNHDIKRICTRNYIPPKTAFYLNWLIFKNEDLAQEFLVKFPQHHTEAYISKLNNDLTDLKNRFNDKLARKAYDLGRYPEDHRRAAANRFIEIDNQINDLKNDIELLTIAKKLKEEWSKVFINM